MRRNELVATAFLLLAAGNAVAADSGCNPILAASEARIKLSAWHRVTTLTGGMRMENMKIDGKFLHQIGGVWMKSPVSFDQAERDMLAQIRSGEVKLMQCASAGSDIVDGVPVNVITSRVEMKGAPAADSKLYIGKLDGLPYKQVGETVNVTYKYKNISTPKL